MAQTWVLDEVGLHQVVEDVVLANPLHGAAAGGAERRALHPARVAGGAEGVHARLQAEQTLVRVAPPPVGEKKVCGSSSLPDAVVQQVLTNDAGQTLLHLVRLGAFCRGHHRGRCAATCRQGSHAPAGGVWKISSPVVFR